MISTLAINAINALKYRDSQNFPCDIALGSKWSHESAAHYQVTLSGEWERGCDVLGPAVNGAVTALTQRS